MTPYHKRIKVVWLLLRMSISVFYETSDQSWLLHQIAACSPNRLIATIIVYPTNIYSSKKSYLFPCPRRLQWKMFLQIYPYNINSEHHETFICERYYSDKRHALKLCTYHIFSNVIHTARITHFMLQDSSETNYSDRFDMVRCDTYIMINNCTRNSIEGRAINDI